MPVYEGVVARLMADSKAEVVIRPGKAGIPGAPELTEKVCHCATNGSTVRTEALNWVGADVGDWVVVSRRAGVLMKNAVALLGMPVIGGLSGLVAGGILFDGVASCVTAMVVSAGLGLSVGLVIGATIYRRLSADEQPVIRRIIRTRTNGAFVPHCDPSWTRGRLTSVDKSAHNGPFSILPSCSKAESNCILSRAPRRQVITDDT